MLYMSTGKTNKPKQQQHNSKNFINACKCARTSVFVLVYLRVCVCMCVCVCVCMQNGNDATCMVWQVRIQSHNRGFEPSHHVSVRCVFHDNKPCVILANDS